MLIRSQDKVELHNMSQAVCIGAMGNDIGIAYSADQRGCIGSYSSNEKAIKVLDMIQEHNDRHKYDMELSDTFQMPQDSEVEE